MASLNIESWTANHVAQWIKGLGPQFESCSESFVDEEINGKALLSINTEYLTELSVENVNDQNAILDAVHCLIEVDSSLREETVHGQVIVVNDQTKLLINKLEKESQDASEGDITTSESSTKIAGQVYQLAKKLLSWLLRSPFSEMNACWPLKDSVCRVVRDMTDESLLKNRDHLQENLKKLQTSFDTFLNEEPLHEVFKQSPVLVNEEFTLEGEGLGIGITTSHHIHTVNSVTAESPAGKNGNIKNGDEIVNVNGQCVIAWPQKNVINVMKSKPDSVSLTLKKLPPVIGPLNKPLDKPGTPLSEMNVVMDRTKVAPERPARVEMKEAGIKEETSLEMQAIENENASEENSQVEARIEGIQEEDEGKQENEENKKSEVGNVSEKENTGEETKQDVEKETPAKEDETEVKPENQKEETEKQEDSSKVVENGQPENNEKVDEVKAEDAVENNDKKEENQDEAEKLPVVETVVDETESKAPAEEQCKSEEASGAGNDEEKIEVNGDVKSEVKEHEKSVEEDKKKDEKIVNGEAEVKAPESSENIQSKNTEENSESKPKAQEDETGIAINIESPSPKKEQNVVAFNGQNGASPKKEPASPSKKPGRPELPKMKMGSVKNVTVGGTSAKQVEVYGTSKVVLRDKKKTPGGAPNKRISCIDLGEADCEGWLTKRSGGHGIVPTRWRRQWCVLKEEHLYYYKTSFDREAGGVIEITGYNMSSAPEIKKPFAFKCEKDGEKKYFFHADNEVDREMWIKALNSTSRGERKQKETSAIQMSEAAERKSSVSVLKPGQNNRPRTSSVLAGIRFNYYDDDDIEENRKISHEPSAAERVNEGLFNGQKDDTKPSTEDQAIPDQNVLKIAVGVEEDACQVIPVGEVKDDMGTNSSDKNSPEEVKREPQEKIEEQPKNEPTTSEDNIEHKEDNQPTSESKVGEVSVSVDTAGPQEVVNGDAKGEVSTPELNVETKTDNSDLSKESPGTNETPVGDENVKVNGLTETDEGVGKESNHSTTTSADDTTKSEDTVKSEDVVAESEGVPVKPEDATAKSGDDITKSEDVGVESEDVTAMSENATAKSEDGTVKSDDVTVKSEGGTVEVEDPTAKSEDDKIESDDVTVKSESGTVEVEDSTVKSEDDKIESNDVTVKSESGTVEVEDSTVKSEDDKIESDDVTVKSESGTVEIEDPSVKSEDDKIESDDVTVKSESGTVEIEDPSVKSEDDTTKSDDVAVKSESGTVEPEDPTAKSEDNTTKSEDGVVKSEDGTVESQDATVKSEDSTTKCEGEAGTSEEKRQDDFQEVAESIKEAEIGLDGTEKSPEAMLRRLSINSTNEIMNKVVQLRVLKQSLKDKEQSMDVIDELLNSEVTPESIAEWRAKYETVTNSNSNVCNDLNENSQL